MPRFNPEYQPAATEGDGLVFRAATARHAAATCRVSSDDLHRRSLSPAVRRMVDEAIVYDVTLGIGFWLDADGVLNYDHHGEYVSDDFHWGSTSWPPSSWGALDFLEAFHRHRQDRVQEVLEKRKTAPAKQQGKGGQKAMPNITHEETEKKSFKQKVKEDVSEAQLRIVASQLMKGLKEPLIEALASQGTTTTQAAAFLETPLGGLLLAGVVGYGADYVPGIEDSPYMQKIAREVRVQGMATAGDEYADKFTGAIRSVLTALVTKKSLPPAVAAEMSRIAGGTQVPPAT